MDAIQTNEAFITARQSAAKVLAGAPFIDSSTPEGWKQLIHAMRHGAPIEGGGPVQVTEEAYEHFLDCLPPLTMRPTAVIALLKREGHEACAELVANAANLQGAFIFLEGYDNGQIFMKADGKYYHIGRTLREYNS